MVGPLCHSFLCTYLSSYSILLTSSVVWGRLPISLSLSLLIFQHWPPPWWPKWLWELSGVDTQCNSYYCDRLDTEV